MSTRKLLMGAVAATVVSTLAVPVASAAPVTSASSGSAGGAGIAGGPAGPGTGLRGRVGLSPEATTVPGFGNLTLTVDAHAAGRHGAAGWATLQHEFFNPDGSWQGTVRLDVDVDCLAVTEDGATAAVTGTVRALTYDVPPGTPEQPRPSADWHPETGFSFPLDRPAASGSGSRPGTGAGGGGATGTVGARVGWSGVPNFNDPAAPPVAAKCVAPAADFYVISGSYRLKR